MEGKNKISNQQIKNLLITTVIGAGILSMPSTIAMAMDNHGWVPILLGGLFIIPFAIMLDRLFKIYPNKSIFEIGEGLFGKVIYRILLMISVAYAVVSVAFASRVFGEVVKAFLLEATPIRVIVLVMILASAYLARSSSRVLGRTATMIYPLLVGVVGFVIAVVIPDSDPTNLLPISTVSFRKIPQAVFSTLLYYGGYEVVFIVYNDSENQKDNLKYIIRGILIVTGIYLVVYITALNQFGLEQLKNSIWPTITMVSNVDLPGYFLENLEGVILALWVVAIYATIGPYFYMSGRSLQHIFNTKSHHIFILPLIPIVYYIALIPDNIVQVYEDLGRIVGYFSVLAMIITPTVMFITALIKRRIKG